MIIYHITPFFKDMCKNADYSWFSSIFAKKKNDGKPRKTCMPLDAIPAIYTTFEKIEFSQVSPCFFTFSRLFCKKCAKTWKQRVFKQENSFCTCFAFFPQILVKHESNVFSSRKVVFCTKLAKTHEKRSIFEVKSNSGYYII